MSRFKVWRLLSGVIAVISLAPGFASVHAQAPAGGLTVFAAASMKEALDDHLKAFTARTGISARASYAGSNALAKQIESGAPAGLFISADEVWMDYVKQKGLIVPSSLKVLVGNELVLVAPTASKVELTISPGFLLAPALAGGRLAVANPDAVPAGVYARTALTRLGVWSSVESSLARAENVRAALAFVARGEAPLGVVYRTDALAEPRVRVVAAFPRDSHPAIVYPAALVKGHDTRDARTLLDYLASDVAKAVWLKHGFVVAK